MSMILSLTLSLNQLAFLTSSFIIIFVPAADKYKCLRDSIYGGHIVHMSCQVEELPHQTKKCHVKELNRPVLILLIRALLAAKGKQLH